MRESIILIGLILSLCILLTGCTDIFSSRSDEIDTEKFFVSGNNEVRTINYIDAPIELHVSGNNNIVTVTRDTDIAELFLSGNNCLVKLSRSHSVNPHMSGNNCLIQYYD